MHLIFHEGYWGINDDMLYWADTLEELKLDPKCKYLTADQASKIGSTNYGVILNHEPETEVLVIASNKRVTLDGDYEMLQILLKSVVLGLAPKVVEIVAEVTSEALSETMAALRNLAGLDALEPEPVKLIQRKSDTTKLTQYMYDFIVYAHEDWKSFNRQNPKNKKPMEVLIEAINTYMGTNKSRTSLGRVWTGQINRDDLPVGIAYFEYPHKTKDLS
jgi:hypothetical protein